MTQFTVQELLDIFNSKEEGVVSIPTIMIKDTTQTIQTLSKNYMTSLKSEFNGRAFKDKGSLIMFTGPNLEGETIIRGTLRTHPSVDWYAIEQMGFNFKTWEEITVDEFNKVREHVITTVDTIIEDCRKMLNDKDRNVLRCRDMECAHQHLISTTTVRTYTELAEFSVDGYLTLVNQANEYIGEKHKLINNAIKEKFDGKCFIMFNYFQGSPDLEQLSIVRVSQNSKIDMSISSSPQSIIRGDRLFIGKIDDKNLTCNMAEMENVIYIPRQSILCEITEDEANKFINLALNEN